MNRSESYLVYVPPKSNSHGHWVRDKNMVRGLKRTVDAFVKNLNMSQFGSLDLRLEENISPESHTLWENTRELLINRLGEPDTLLQTGVNGVNNLLRWQVIDKSVFDVLEIYEEAKDKGIFRFDRLWLHSAYHYGHADVPHGLVNCFVISCKLLVSLHLILPYMIQDERLYTLISNLNSDLPFKMSNKHFRRLGPGKNGYGQWKLDKEVQDKIDLCLST
jgi:hypothetical protein